MKDISKKDRLKRMGQELYSSCPKFYQKNIFKVDNRQLIKISNHNEIWKVKIDNEYYILKKAKKNNNIITNNNKLLEEGKKLMSLDNERIVKCYKILNDSFAGLILECIEGETLEYILKFKSIDISSIYEIVMEILHGVKYLHTNKIIHNDLNPSNIIFSIKSKEVKIIDLGIATYSYTGKNRMGADQFSAPEQLLKRKTTYKTDVWSIGCILFYFIEGYRPFKRKYDQLKIDPVISNHAPKPLKKLILSMLEKEPCKRPDISECMEVLSVLKELYE